MTPAEAIEFRSALRRLAGALADFSLTEGRVPDAPAFEPAALNVAGAAIILAEAMHDMVDRARGGPPSRKRKPL